MNYETYFKKLKELEIEYYYKKNVLAKEYAFANNSLKIGDKVTDHIGTIIIEKIDFHIFFSKPEATYFGIELKKDGTPKKNGNKRTVYQSNIVKKEIIQLVSREQALGWWNKLTTNEKIELSKMPKRHWETLTGREIEKIYNTVNASK